MLHSGKMGSILALKSHLETARRYLMRYFLTGTKKNEPGEFGYIICAITFFLEKYPENFAGWFKF